MGKMKQYFLFKDGVIINEKLPNTAKKWYELQKENILKAWE